MRTQIIYSSCATKCINLLNEQEVKTNALLTLQFAMNSKTLWFKDNAIHVKNTQFDTIVYNQQHVHARTHTNWYWLRKLKPIYA